MEKMRLISSTRIMIAGTQIFTEWNDGSVSIEDIRYQSTQNSSARTASALDHATLSGSGVRALAAFLHTK